MTSAIEPESFLYDEADTGVATITLNRPERLNALTFEVYRELTETFRSLGDLPSVRAVRVTEAPSTVRTSSLRSARAGRPLIASVITVSVSVASHSRWR